MDLYRVLRISIYLLVASGAFAICVAEGSPAFLIGVFAFGGLAYLTVDSRRMRPVRMEFASAMALALLVYSLLPLREDSGWDHFPAAFAHFLCALEVLLFFTAFRGPMLVVFCASTLAVVIISGVMEHSITLLARMICFISVTSWTLFVHSLWRARESFRSKAVAAGGATVTGGAAETRGPERVLSERAFWQELALTGGMSATCMALGVLLYFAAPRVSGLSNWLPQRGEQPTVGPRQGTNPGGGTEGGGGHRHTGMDDAEISLNDFNPIHRSTKQAMRVRFTPLSSNLKDANGRLLLKIGAYGEYHEGLWSKTTQKTLLKEPDKTVADPSLSGATYKGVEIKETIQNLTLSIHELPLAGPVQRFVSNTVSNPTIDEEGTVTSREPYEFAEVWVTAPPGIAQIAKNGPAGHDKFDRYGLQLDVSPKTEHELRQFAQLITAECSKDNPLQTAQTIADYLRTRYEYTLELDKLSPGGDPIERFLLSPDAAQRRGHCGYFASAFVILCRLNGLPARLVKGFAADFPAREQADAELVFDDSQAHAWGEVYFKNVGWVAFDPTPRDPNQKPPVSPENDLKVSAVQANPPTQLDKNGNAVNQSWSWFLNFNQQDQRDALDWVKGELGGGGTMLGNTGGWIEAGIAWTLVLGLLGGIVFLFLKRTGRRMPVFFTGPKRARAAVAFYNDLLHVLSRRGFVRRPGQTPREFAEFVVKRGGSNFQAVMTVTEIFESVRYGGVDVSQDEFNALQKSLDSLRDLTFGNKSDETKNRT